MKTKITKIENELTKTETVFDFMRNAIVSFRLLHLPHDPDFYHLEIKLTPRIDSGLESSFLIYGVTKKDLISIKKNINKLINSI